MRCCNRWVDVRPCCQKPTGHCAGGFQCHDSLCRSQHSMQHSLPWQPLSLWLTNHHCAEAALLHNGCNNCGPCRTRPARALASSQLSQTQAPSQQRAARSSHSTCRPRGWAGFSCRSMYVWQAAGTSRCSWWQMQKPWARGLTLPSSPKQLGRSAAHAAPLQLQRRVPPQSRLVLARRQQQLAPCPGRLMAAACQCFMPRSAALASSRLPARLAGARAKA